MIWNMLQNNSELTQKFRLLT